MYESLKDKSFPDFETFMFEIYNDSNKKYFLKVFRFIKQTLLRKYLVPV